MENRRAEVSWLLGWPVFLLAIISAIASSAQAAPAMPILARDAQAARYDAIIVGAGYGGLATAAILSKNGLKTLVVEETDQIGGRLGSSLYNGYWLDWGARGAKDFADNFIVITKQGQYGKKAASAAGADVAWVGPLNPLVMMHRMKDGKVVPINADAEGSAKFATEALDLSSEQTTRFLSIIKELAAEDPEKWMNVTLEEWLSNVKDPALHEAFLRIAMVHMADPLNESSVGRWILMLRNPQEVYKIDDREVGSQQGLMEAYARVIRRHGGDIRLGLQTMEISMDGSKIAGVVVRDKVNVVQEFHAPVVVFSQPIWEAFKVLDESRFPPDVVANARKQELGYHGDLMVLNIGIKRIPRIRATGKQDTYIGFNQFIEEPSGWYFPTLSSKKAAPPGKHFIAMATVREKSFTFKEGKARLEYLKAYMRRYYSDLDEVIEWERYQWPKIWGTSAYWRMASLSPLQVPGLDGLYFTGTTVQADGVFQDVDASSALQVSQRILAQRAQH